VTQLVLDEDGEIVGELTDVQCPTCDRDVVYNGNYFCRAWTYPFTGEPGTCDWALSHDDETGEPIGPVDRAVWELLKVRYGPLREFLAEHPEEDRS
jgi:hypothetical protein